ARRATALPLREGLLAAIQAIAGARPVLLLLDDAHCAAPDVLEDLAVLAERCANLPVCVVIVSARSSSSGVDAIAERVGRDLRGLSLTTASLTEDDVADLVRSAFPRYGDAQR